MDTPYLPRTSSRRGGCGAAVTVAPAVAVPLPVGSAADTPLPDRMTDHVGSVTCSVARAFGSGAHGDGSLRITYANTDDGDEDDDDDAVFRCASNDRFNATSSPVT